MKTLWPILTLQMVTLRARVALMLIGMGGVLDLLRHVR